MRESLAFLVLGTFSHLNRFQMVSLLELATVTEDGVRFLSPHDGSPMYSFAAASNFFYILMDFQAAYP